MRRPLLALSLLLAASCGPARVGEPLGPPVRLASVEAEQGRVVFMRHCHQCHPGGASGLAPAINDKPLPPFLMRFQVRNGLGAMPAFDRDVISDPELDAIVAYLLELRRRG